MFCQSKHKIKQKQIFLIASLYSTVQTDGAPAAVSPNLETPSRKAQMHSNVHCKVKHFGYRDKKKRIAAVTCLAVPRTLLYNLSGSHSLFTEKTDKRRKRKKKYGVKKYWDA